MTAAIQLALSIDEADAVLNALNYFAFAMDPDECGTLIGIEQSRVQGLHRRLKCQRQDGKGGD